MLRIFKDRIDAGTQLAEKLRGCHLQNPKIFGLPRGGVPVAFEIAQALHAPLDVVLVRKIGAPMHEEFAIGAVTDGDPPYVYIDRNTTDMLRVSDQYIAEQTARQIAEIERRRARYGVEIPPSSLRGCTAIVVDDGIATGATARVALQALRKREPAALVLAVPVAPANALADLKNQVDRAICLLTPEYFPGVGAFYRDFTQVDDSIVIDLLQRARLAMSSANEKQKS